MLPRNGEPIQELEMRKQQGYLIRTAVASATATTMLLAACTTLPPYAKPSVDVPASYANASATATPAAPGWSVAAPADGLRTLLAPRALGRIEPSDVIHFPFSLLGPRLPCPSVVTIHDLMWLEQPELVDARPLLRRVLAGAHIS